MEFIRIFSIAKSLISIPNSFFGKSRFLLFTLLFLSAPSLLWAQRGDKTPSFTVVVVEEGSEEPIPGALVQLEGQRALTDGEGKVDFPFPQKERCEVLVRMVGYNEYKSIVKPKAKGLHLHLVPVRLDEVVVVGDKPRSESTTIAVRLGENALRSEAKSSLAKVLQEVPGMSSISSGATIMKPVIQGMHSSRILLINNGVRQEGQQWGADHAPEVDISTATSVEVIKGAESIRYGAGAIGGVILLETAPLPKWGEPLKGRLSLSATSNDRGAEVNGDLSGSVAALRGLTWRTQAAYSVAGDYETAKYVLNNTGAREGGFTGVLGVDRPRFSTDLFVSYYSSRLGIFTGSHIGTLEDLLERFELGEPQVFAPRSYKIAAPKQEVQHWLVRLSGVYKLKQGSLLRVQYDFQNDDRREFEIRVGSLAHKPALGLLLASHGAQAIWESSKEQPLRFVVGSSAQLQQNKTTNTGTVPLIPNYAGLTFGGYGISKWVRPRYEVALGVRYDYKYLNALGYGLSGEEYGGEHHYNSPSFSLSGLVRPLEGVTFSSNLGLAWRAPDVNELYSKGLHHGAAAYEEGDATLQPEASWKWNNELRYVNSWIHASATAFLQSIGNYIFASPEHDPNTGGIAVKELVAGVFPIFRYRQVDARFWGGDVQLRVHPFKGWEYTFEGQWIRAIERKTGGYLPYIPSDRYRQSIQWESHNLFPHNQFSFGLDWVFVTKQRRFDPSIDFLPTTPDAYHLLGASAEYTHTMSQGRSWKVSLRAENLLNALYKEYTNRFRYFAHEKGRDVQLILGYYF